jgi:hypothetical protein
LAWSAHLRPDPLHCALPSHDDIRTSTNQAPVSELLTVWKWVDFANCRTRRASLDWSLEMWCDSGSVYRACILGFACWRDRLQRIESCSSLLTISPWMKYRESASRPNAPSRTRWTQIWDLSPFWATRLFLSDNKPWFSSGIPTAGIAGLMRREGLLLMTDMSIHAGVQCAKCSRVHFPTTLKRIPEATIAVYQITCPPPCGAVTYFRLEDMRTFSVPDRVYERGYAEPDQYRYLF